MSKSKGNAKGIREGFTFEEPKFDAPFFSEVESLMPCPFCEGKPAFSIEKEKMINGDVIATFSVFCTRCLVGTPRARGTFFGDPEMAAQFWNTRVEP